MTGPPQLREAISDQVVNVLGRIFGAVWAVGGLALTLVVSGSPLLAFDQALRPVLSLLVGAAALVMVVRAFAPQLRVWRGWTLQLIGGVAVTSSAMSLFTANDLGYTAGRIGWSLLLATVAAVAYLHWLAERWFLQ